MPTLIVKLVSNRDGAVVEAQLEVGELDTQAQIQAKYDALETQLFRNRNVADYTVDRSAVDERMAYVNHMYTAIRMS